MKMRWGIYALGLLAVLGLSQCARSARTQELTLKGSDTMVLLGQRWAERYMAEHPGTVVQVTGGGSGTGIAALINGTTDICMASRPIKPDENAKLEAQFGQAAHETVVARDGLSIYVNEANGVKEITLARLRDVYTGVVTDWKDLGGAPGHINVYGRENSSGTYVYFKEHVLKDADFAPGVQTLPGTAAVVNAVARDPQGIGYGGAAYAKGVRDLAVRADEASPAVLPTRDNVMSGTYPVSRPLYLYTRTVPQGPAAAFIAYALGDSGQALVDQVGYFPVK